MGVITEDDRDANDWSIDGVSETPNVQPGTYAAALEGLQEGRKFSISGLSFGNPWPSTMFVQRSPVIDPETNNYIHYLHLPNGSKKIFRASSLDVDPSTTWVEIL